MNLFGKILIAAVFVSFFAQPAFTQPFTIYGVVVEPDGINPLSGANVAIYNRTDTSLVRGASTDQKGEFALQNIQQGEYFIRISFIGYRTENHVLKVGEEEIDKLRFVLSEDPVQLEELRVDGQVQRMEIRGDTTVFNAGAFTTQPDAVAEDLIRKMPGFEVEDGEIRAQGEEIRRILVDGEDFFGDDPQIALSNLPASIISQVQVFDRQSDQARFTGFDDGEGERTINFVTRGGLRQGRFGRFSASGGTTERYSGSGNANFFKGPQRISVIGLSNNINQQNFSSEDLSGVMEASSSGGRGGRRGRGGGSTDNFRVGQQSGISDVHSFGVNYIDRWDDRWRVTGNYFFNTTDNYDNQILERQYHEGFLDDQLYDEQSWSQNDRFNHRLNARVEHTIDDKRSVILTPNANILLSESDRSFEGMTFIPSTDPDNDTSLLNSTSNAYESDNQTYNIGTSLLYRRSFETEGRTFSVNLRSVLNNGNGEQLQVGESYFFGDDESEQIFRDNQNSDIRSGSRSISTDFQYTEPLGERSQIFAGYRPELRTNYSERDAYQFDEESEQYNEFDPRLSSRYDNTTTSHRISSGLRNRGERYNAHATLSWQKTRLNGEQVLPIPVDTRHTYKNLLPRAMVHYRLSDQRSIHLSYNTRTNTPSASQLHDVIDNTDPLRLTGGNPQLLQEYSHSWSARYRSIYPERGRSVSGYANVSYTIDNIGNVTFTAPRDTTLRDGITMGRGARLITPDNTGNALDIRTSINYGLPMTVIYSNVNLSTGLVYRRSPVIVNEQRNDSRNTTVNGRFSLSSNISSEIDFMASYQAAYTFVDNSLQPDLDRNYYSGRVRGSMNIMPWRGLVLASDVNIRHFSGGDDALLNDVYYWNGAIGYKFLENKAAEVRFTVVDILAQNSNRDRVFSDTYIEEIRSEALTRFAMVTISWNFRNFTGNVPEDRGNRRGRGQRSRS